MLRVLALLLISVSLYAYTLDNVPVEDKYILPGSTVCSDITSATNDPERNKYHTVYVYDKYYLDFDPTDEDDLLADTTASYNGIKCSPSSTINSYWSSSTRSLYYKGDNPDEWIVVKIKTYGLTDLPVVCEELNAPSQTVVDGRDYQGILNNEAACQSFHNDNGDGTGYTFINPHADTTNCTTGYCYFNVYNPCENIPTPPSQTVVDSKDFQAVTNDSGCISLANSYSDGLGYSFVNYSEGDTYCNDGYCYYNLAPNDPIDDGGDTTVEDPSPDDSNDTTGGDTVVDLAELIPYIDDLESKNDQIINNTVQTNNELSTLNSNLNTLNSTGAEVNGNLETLNSGISDLKSGIDQLNNRNANLDSSLNGINAPEAYDLSGDLTNFASDYQTTLDNTFSSYGNVFGLGGYGDAPSPISFSMFNRTYTVFDISWIGANNVAMIRNIFLVTAYLFGIFIVFRGI
jgi:X-X-X-Leu-X-X-Gly heptad repeat protein